MKNPLNKRLIRDLKNHKGRYISISVMLILIISLLSGFLANVVSIKDGIKDNKETYKVEDGSLESFFELQNSTIEKIKDLDVQIYENFYKDENVLKDRKLRIYKNRQDINIQVITEGNMPENDDEIAIDRLFAKQNNLKVGSKLDIDDKEFKVTGTIALPDYTSLFENNSNIMMDAIHFGVAIVSKESFEDVISSNSNFKYSYYFNNRNLDKQEKNDLSEHIEKILVEDSVNIKDFCIQKNNQSISFVEEDMGSDEPMMKVFCYLLIIVMAFVFAVIVSSTIEEDAAIIGTLLANGYKKIEILFYYMKMSIIVTLISALIGNILGYTIMPKVFKTMYYNNYSLADFKIELNMDAVITTTVIPIFIMFLINTLFITRKLSLSPLKFMRKELKKNDRGKGVKLPKISFLSRFRLRVIIQNKASFFILFIGILFGSLILIFGMCMEPVIEKYIEDIKDTAISEYQYILKSPVEIEENDIEKFTISNLDYYFDKIDKNMSISFYGIDEDSTYVKDLNIDNNEVYISDGFMKKIKAKVGDTIVFKNPYTEDEYSLKVAGTYNYSSGLAVFMKRENLNDLLEYNRDYFNGYFSEKELDIDDIYLASTIEKDDMIKLGEQMTDSLGETAYICIFASVIMYMALMYVLTKVVIEKNSLYISYMKVFGYNNKEIKKLYLNAVTIFVLISLIIQIPLEDYLLKKCFDAALLKVSGYLEVFVPWYVYIIVIVMGVVSYTVINALHMRDVNKIDMSEALKNRE